MQPKSRDAAHLWDMLEAVKAVVRFTAELSLSRFIDDDTEQIRLSVERKLEILGEAARRVTPSFREAHPELPWREIVGLRNLISHEYDRVDYGEIYRIARVQVPALIGILESVVPPTPEAGK
jgi:uncharacterized protein with HEPN domain